MLVARATLERAIANQRPKTGNAARLLAAVPLWLIVGLCCLLPMVWMAMQVAQTPSMLLGVRWSSFRAALLGRTLLYNGVVAVLATAMALPAAIVVGRGRGWLARGLTLLLPLALVVPSIVYTYGWMQVFRLLGLTFDPAGAADVTRCVWVLASWLWALPAALIGLSLRFMDSQVQQQGMLDGVLWRVTGRQLIGPIVASMSLVMVLAAQEFVVYEQTGISVIATEIRTVFETGSLGLSSEAITGVLVGSGRGAIEQGERAAAAVATALPLLAIVACLSLLAMSNLKGVSSEGGEVGNWPRTLDAPVWAIGLGYLMVLVALGVPTAALGVSMKRAFDPAHSWNVLGPQVTGSLLIGLASAVAAWVVAGLACVSRARWLLGVALVSFLIGGELLGIANIRIYNRTAPWPLSSVRVSGNDVFGWIYNNAPVMVIAYIGRFGWLALLAADASWSRPMRDLRAMAAVDGAGLWRTAVHVIWPVTWPILAASALLVMLLAMTEVPATVLLSPQRPQMLMPMLMTWVHNLRYDDMLEGSLLLMGVVFLVGSLTLALVWLGIRLVAALRGGGVRFIGSSVARSVILIASGVMFLGGCGNGTQPEEVWGATGTGKGQTVYPRGICYSRFDDTFFVVDRLARVQRLDDHGTWLNEWRMPEFQRGKPIGLTIGPDANLYIADTHYARVMVYTPKGELVRTWGSEGNGPGQFTYPTDVSFDAQGRVFVSEYGDNDRIQVFDGQGKYLYMFGRFGSGDGEFARPESMVIDGALVYVADSCNHRIAVFRTDGRFVRNMGSLGSALGQFRFPYGLDQDSKGHLIVAEFGNNRVQSVDKETGRGIRTWGVAGREKGQLAYPWGVAVDRKDRVVVVDSGNNRMQVFVD